MLDYQNPALPIEQRVADLLSRMTLEEKAARLVCCVAWNMPQNHLRSTIVLWM